MCATSPHVVFYRVSNDVAEIVRVLDGRRDLEEIFVGVRKLRNSGHSGIYSITSCGVDVSSSEGDRNSRQRGADDYHYKARWPGPKTGVTRKNDSAKKQR